MTAVGIEGKPAQLARLQVLGGQASLFVAVQHAQLATDVRRGPDDHQRGDHAGMALGILVRLEELAGAVDQQVVQPGVEPGQAQCLSHLSLQLGEGAGRPVQGQPVGIDLAGVAHRGVEQGLLAPAEVGRRADSLKGLGVGWRQRLRQRAEAVDRHCEVCQGQAAPGAETIPGSLVRIRWQYPVRAVGKQFDQGVGHRRCFLS